MDNRFLNFHLKADCRNNSKIGFQNIDSDVQALQKGLSYVRDKLIKEGLLKNSDTFVVYARFTESDAAEVLELDSVQMADGSTRTVTTEPKTDSAEGEEIPF